MTKTEIFDKEETNSWETSDSILKTEDSHNIFTKITKNSPQ